MSSAISLTDLRAPERGHVCVSGGLSPHKVKVGAPRRRSLAFLAFRGALVSLWRRVCPLQESVSAARLARPHKEVRQLINTLSRPGFKQEAFLEALVHSSGFDPEEIEAALDRALGSLSDVQLYTLARKMGTSSLRGLLAMLQEALQEGTPNAPWMQGQLGTVAAHLRLVQEKLHAHLARRAYTMALPSPQVSSRAHRAHRAHRARAVAQVASVCKRLEAHGAGLKGHAPEAVSEAFQGWLEGHMQQMEVAFEHKESAENLRPVAPEDLGEIQMGPQVETLKQTGELLLETNGARGFQGLVEQCGGDSRLAFAQGALLSGRTVNVLYEIFLKKGSGLVLPGGLPLEGGTFERTCVRREFSLRRDGHAIHLTMGGLWRLGDHFNAMTRTPLDEKKSHLSVTAHIAVSPAGVCVEGVDYDATLFTPVEP